MSGHFPLLAGVLTLVLGGGCAIGYTTSGTTPSPVWTGDPRISSAPVSPTPDVAPAGGPSAEIEVDITGGPHAGLYRAVASPGCYREPAQNRFTVTYADDAAPAGFVAFHLVLRDAALALEDESRDFLAQVSLGGAGAGISYTIDPVNGAGSGSALLETSPSNATLDLIATAADGAQLELSVMCDFS